MYQSEPGSARQEQGSMVTLEEAQESVVTLAEKSEGMLEKKSEEAQR